MKICIIGAGVVGSNLARRLSMEGYEISIIDRDKNKVEDLQNKFDISAYSCDAFDIKCIRECEDYDFFVIVTNKDEVNLSIALMLKAVFSKEKVLVRVDREMLSKREIEDFLNIEIINTFNEIYKNIEMFINYPFMTYFNEFEEGDFVLFGYKVGDDKLKNIHISELKTIREIIPFTIVAIERDNKILIPSGKRVLLEGDIIYILLHRKHLNSFIKEFRIKNKPVESIFFLGISSLGENLIRKFIEKDNLYITVIEPDLNKCEKLAEEYPDITIIHGNFTDKEVLEKENVANADLIISASYKEDSILACILLKKLGAKKVLALIEQPEYEEIAHSLGIDIPLVSRKLVARKVYRKIKHRGFLDVFELMENIHIYEISVDKNMSGKTVSEISKGNFVILGLKRDNELKIVTGNTILQEGDILIILEGEESE